MIRFQPCDEQISPVCCNNSVAIVMSYSKEYLPYACVTIFSVLKNSSKKYFYDFIVFSTSADTGCLEEILSGYDNVSFRIVDIQNFISSDMFVEGHV